MAQRTALLVISLKVMRRTSTPFSAFLSASIVLHVPGDRLALAVRVGGEVQRAGALQRLGDRADLLLAAVVGLPVHGEVLVRADRAVLRRQVAHMAEAGQTV